MGAVAFKSRPKVLPSVASFACRFRDGPFDAYETSGGFHVQTARPQLRDLARRVRRRPPPGTGARTRRGWRSEEHTSELQSQSNLVCRLLLEKKKKKKKNKKM